MIDLRVLGPVRALGNGRDLRIGHPRQRSLLAVLLVDVNTVVSYNRLVELLWDGRPPRSARNVMAGYATRIRKALSAAPSSEEPPRLVARDGGYVLEASPATVDLYRFRELTAQAAGADEDGRRSHLLGAALDLWSGSALGDLSGSHIGSLRAALEAERRAAFLGFYDARLRLGRHREVLPRLQELADEYPYDEEIALRLMIAHRASGNPTAAFEQYAMIRSLSGQLAHVSSQQPHGGEERLEAWQRLRVPRIPDRFVGRKRELRSLDTLAATGARDTFSLSTHNLFAISGIAGSGKTTLAIWWAHGVRDLFPDGQFFINMRGHDPNMDALTPEETLAQCLLALGLSPVDLPPTLDERAALYRTLLVDRRALLIFDDVAGVDQAVRLLPPPESGCAVLVTSRERMPELAARYGAGEAVLDVLDDAAGVELLAGLIGSERVAREPEAALDFVRACGHLPLAVSLGAAYVVSRPDEPLANLVVSAEQDDWTPPTIEGGEMRVTIRHAFDLSYQRMTPARQRIFRLLGVMPGIDYGTDAVAALAGCSSAEAEEQLGALVRANLLTEYASRRYRQHALVKLYAVDLSAAVDSQHERDDALGRLLWWYRSVVQRVTQSHSIQTHGDKHSAPWSDLRQLVDVGNGSGGYDITWLDMERPNICAAIKVASGLGINPLSWQLAESMLGFIRLHPGGEDWFRAVRAALDAATRSGDRRAHAAMLINVADSEFRRGEHEPVLARGRAALAASRSAGWRVGEALALGALARSYWSMGMLGLADRYLRSARQIHRELDDAAGEANAVGRMALNAHDQGRLRDARRDYQRALDLSERAGSRFGEMRVPAFIALISRDLGLYDEAARWCDLAIGLSREMDFSEGVAKALACRAAVFSDVGVHDSAIKTALEASASIPLLADPRIEVDCLVQLGSVAATAGDADLAMRNLSKALRVSEPLRYRQGIARAHAEQAAAYSRLGRYEEAASSCRSARAAAGDDLRLVHALVSMTEADVSLASGRCAEAVAGYRTASALYQASSHRLGEVRALLSWGRAAATVPGHGRPDRPWRRALRVAAPLGVPEADTLRVLLDRTR